MRRSRLVPLLLVAALCLAGCSDDSAKGSASDERAAAIIRTGYPVDADAADDGSHLVLYQLPVQDSAETTESAWRLYDGGGSKVAEGLGGVSVTGTGDGFWLNDEIGSSAGFHVASDGTVTRLPVGTGTARRGDVDVAASDSLEETAYSPATKKVFTPAPPAARDTQGWTLDVQGRQWAVDPAGTVRETIDGRWRTVRPVPLADGEQVAGAGLVRVGEWLVVPVVGGLVGERTRYRGFAARLNGAPPDERWRMIRPGPLGRTLLPARAPAFGVNDSYYVFWDHQVAQPSVLSMVGGTWTRLTLPDTEHAWTLEGGRDGIYAFAPDVPGGPWFSPDAGQSWVQLPR